MMARESLIAYAMSFASFLLDSRIAEKINKIILFGSVARGNHGKESDIDLFIDTSENIEKEADKLLGLFRASKTNGMWQLKGVKNEISLKVGSLKKWPMRRDVISAGIMLYGKYNETPEGASYYLMIKMDLRNIKTAKQMSIWRRLYGYKQKIGSKVYTGKGLVERLGGTKIGKAVVIVPMDNRKEMLDFLNKNKVRYTLNEIWSDTF